MAMTRSQIMARVRSRGNESTELNLIKILRSAGLRGWRRHWPVFGSPDFAFPKARLAVFVDGCFWHGCPKCYRAPASNVPYWRQKIERNRKRDLRVKGELRKRGWTVMRFWECQLRKAGRITNRIRTALGKF
ncbi:MAG TPA: very short patch repair endonuclease [Candidatus Paceibacterota bacterium]|nr:very short patch repair endonuclease [Verrucomicrobiota bacterium]HSA11599.1 very short patch repair endonuclease [Candidatus Paceibacterota bacterium]